MNLLDPQYQHGDLHGISTLALAHVGDAVYDLMLRTQLCLNGAPTAAKLHRETTRLVCAAAQAQAAQLVLPLLTDEERALYLRGRNAKSHKPPKYADHEAYAAATALETLFGYLYLTGEHARLEQLMSIILEATP